MGCGVVDQELACLYESRLTVISVMIMDNYCVVRSDVA